jgi:hypothetical protein
MSCLIDKDPIEETYRQFLKYIQEYSSEKEINGFTTKVSNERYKSIATKYINVYNENALKPKTGDSPIIIARAIAREKLARDTAKVLAEVEASRDKRRISKEIREYNQKMFSIKLLMIITILMLLINHKKPFAAYVISFFHGWRGFFYMEKDQVTGLVISLCIFEICVIWFKPYFLRFNRDILLYLILLAQIFILSWLYGIMELFYMEKDWAIGLVIFLCVIVIFRIWYRRLLVKF